jgi:hypothetical protein
VRDFAFTLSLGGAGSTEDVRIEGGGSGGSTHPASSARSLHLQALPTTAREGAASERARFRGLPPTFERITWSDVARQQAFLRYVPRSSPGSTSGGGVSSGLDEGYVAYAMVEDGEVVANVSALAMRPGRRRTRGAGRSSLAPWAASRSVAGVGWCGR